MILGAIHTGVGGIETTTDGAACSLLPSYLYSIAHCPVEKTPLIVASYCSCSLLGAAHLYMWIHIHC